MYATAGDPSIIKAARDTVSTGSEHRFQYPTIDMEYGGQRVVAMAVVHQEI
jgi:hypothetical protein